MDKVLNFQVWDGKCFKEVEFKVQGMDPFIYKKADGHFIRDIDLESLAGKMLPEMVISPPEARAIKFWGKDPEGLDEFIAQLCEYQEGLYKPKIKRQKPQWKEEEKKQNAEV